MYLLLLVAGILADPKKVSRDTAPVRRYHIAKIINALQIDPLDIEVSSYIIDTLHVIVFRSCQEVPLKRGLDSLYSSEDNRKSLSFSELRVSSGNTCLPRGSGFCRQMPPELRKLPAILS